MATQGSVSTIAGLEIELILPQVRDFLAQDATLFNYIDEKIQDYNVSMRATRLPVRIQGGMPFSQINADGGDFGIGGADVFDNLTLQPVEFNVGINLTALAKWATDTGKKSVEDVVVESFKNMARTLRQGIESQLNGDSSGYVAVVTGYNSGSNLITVNNPAQFVEGSTYFLAATEGGSNVGVFTVNSVVPTLGGIYVNAVPGGISAGQLCFVQGSSSAQGGGLNGLLNLVTNSTTGSYLGLARSEYPGKLNSAYVNGQGQAITPQIARTLLNLIKLTIGSKVGAQTGRMLAHMNYDQSLAWEQAQVSVTIANQQDIKGPNSVDMLKDNMPNTIAGIKTLVSRNATPGRIDFLDLDAFGKVTTFPDQLYEINGQTEFPVYGASGGIAGATVSYQVTATNVFCNGPREQGYIDNLAVPPGLNLSATYL